MCQSIALAIQLFYQSDGLVACVKSIPCVACDMTKVSFKDTSFEMSKYPNKAPMLVNPLIVRVPLS